MREGFRFSHTIETMRSPQRQAMQLCVESTAGMLMAAGQRQAHGLGVGGHGAGRAHGVAGAGRARHARFEADPLGLVDIADGALGPERIAAHLDLSARTVTGRTLGEDIAGWPAEDDGTILDPAEPIKQGTPECPEAGIALVFDCAFPIRA